MDVNNKKSQNIEKLTFLINKYMLVIFIFTLILIVGVLLFVFVFPSEQDTISDDVILDDFQINDTISPDNINQAVSIEIKRVHKRNIEEVMRKPGISWRKKPLYYVKALFDDVSWNSIDISDWDTGFAGWQVNRFVEDETESVDITFQVIEKNSGLFSDKESIVEEIDLMYDFRTGRWNGDDSMDDSDGYGHYIGTDYEVWFGIYQTEQDGDNIPYWTEINILRTDPTVDDGLLDPDLDGIPTAWEWKWGYDPFSFDNHSYLDPDQDGIENDEEYALSKWLANPFHKEIYLEVDFMQKGPGLFAIEHVFWKESQWMLMDVFTTHDITVIIDDGWPTGSTINGGEYLPYIEEYLSPLSGVLSSFYKYHFADCRKGIFRYIVIHHSGGWNFAQTNQLHSDVISIPSNYEFYSKVFFPPAFTPRVKRLAMAVAVLHELGHSLSLNPDYHAGIDNASQVGRNNLPFIQKMRARMDAIEYWGTYESVMNYNKFGLYLLDYSDGSHGKHDADDWEQVDLTFFQNQIDEKYGVGSN